MSSAKRILTIRVSGRERKEKVRNLLYDLAHFRNMLIILIRRYRELYGEWILNQSVLYGLLSSREYSGKYKKEFKEILGKTMSTFNFQYGVESNERSEPTPNSLILSIPREPSVKPTEPVPTSLPHSCSRRSHEPTG